MSKRERKIGQVAILAIMAGGLLVGLLTLRSTPVYAHVVPAPCDFTTGGGFVITNEGNHANFGLVAGCKNGGFFGHFNFVDHNTDGQPFAGLHISSTQITGYFDPCIGGCGNPPPTYRDICGTANSNTFGPIYFRARTFDGGEPGSGPTGPDKFGLKIANNSDSAVVVSTRFLAGGNIQLHKPNPSTTGPNPPPGEFTACHMDDSGL